MSLLLIQLFRCVVIAIARALACARGATLLLLFLGTLHAGQPNVVLIVADDIGTGWMPFHADRLMPEDLEPEILASYAQKRGRAGKVDPEKHIEAVHDRRYIRYFKRVCAGLPEGKSIYPYVFPVRNNHRAPEDDSVLAGYYCIDTFTPINRNAYLAARRAVDCALTGAENLLGGGRTAYALVRPPGHHAERKVFGGFCYFNSAAIAAHYLSAYGRVAMLDIDYHHGNGQQDIFYHRSDVLTISIHGHPSFTYPYFSGFAEEKGAGEGLGFNVNYPLKEHIDGTQYREVLEKAMERVRRFRPAYLLVPLGLDTSKGDPTGTWNLRAGDFELNGLIIGRFRIPTLFVQEGGYKNRVLGVNARHFFRGFHAGFFNHQANNKE